MHHISDLTTAVMKSYADVPDVTVLSDIFDVKSWLTPYLLKLCYNHSHPHIFRFSLSLSGDVVMHYKDWSMSPWQPTGDGIKLFKVKICGNQKQLC